jgi:hypothetical protein
MRAERVTIIFSRDFQELQDAGYAGMGWIAETLHLILVSMTPQ